MRAIKTIGIGVSLLALAAGGLLGWRAWTERAQGEPQAVEFADAVIGSQITEAKVVALGEATHGTREFQVARIQLLEKMATQGFTTVALESDYAGARIADRWVQGGDGTVEDAVKALGFRIYVTRENAELLSWIRRHNADRPEAERIHLTGFDAQRIDRAKAELLPLLQDLDEQLATRAAAELEPYTDAWASTAADGDLKACAERVGALASDIAALGDETGVAGMLARQIQQACDMRGSGDAYGRVRDSHMFDNLAWLVGKVPGKVLVFGHNGHLDKSGAQFAWDPQYRSMGLLAAEHWGDDYRVIGTEFISADVTVRVGDEYRPVACATNDPLRGMFEGTVTGYLEFAAISDVNRRIVERQLPMGSVGETVNPMWSWLPMTSQVQMRAADAYDALLLVWKGTPTTLL